MSNLLSSIAARREERVQDLHLDLPVPTWGGDLIVRFGLLERSQVEEFGNKSKRTTNDEMDFLLSAVRGLYVKDPHKTQPGPRMEEHDEYVQLVDDNEQPVGFTTVFAEMIGAPTMESARQVLLYSVKDNQIAIAGMAGRLVTWMQNTDAEIADALAGES